MDHQRVQESGWWNNIININPLNIDCLTEERGKIAMQRIMK